MGHLTGALEILDLQDRQSATFQILDYELGGGEIKNDENPSGKEIQFLRVKVRPSDKLTGPAYWDISSKTLQAQLLPLLESGYAKGRVWKVTAYGVRPRKRFSLEEVA